MKNTKEQGITLVALVITIVILIILATITINVAFGEGGLIERAQQAKELTEQATKEEEEKLNAVMSEYGDLINGINEGSTGANEVDPGPVEPEITGTPIADIKGQEQQDTTKVKAPIEPNEDGAEPGTPEEQGNLYVPGGFQIKSDSTNYINEGIVITDGTNEFVWIPVSSAQLADMYQETSVQLSTVTDMTPVTTDRYSKLRDEDTGEIMDTATHKPGTEEYREPDILTSTSEGDAWPENLATIKSVFASELEEYGVDTSSNQTDAQVLNAWAQMLVDEYNETYRSIVTYGGFYIGRYEISGSVESPIVKQGGTVLTADVAGNWYNLKKACNNVVNNENAVSEMIYGNQWDYVLNWLVETGAKTQTEVYDDSSSWGNYTNYNEANPDNQVTDAGTKILPAGSSDYWCANNIYDLAGNAYEWTQEADSTNFRVYRGGHYYFTGSSYPASNRRNSYPGSTYSNTSARAALYVALDAEE